MSASQCQGCGHSRGQPVCGANCDVTRYNHGPDPQCPCRTDSAKAGNEPRLPWWMEWAVVGTGCKATGAVEDCEPNMKAEADR